jgi:carbonic anhydrase
MLMQVPPGELFMLRNIGNMVPSYNESQGIEATVIEYAVTALGIQDIIVCGHSHCDAMTALLEQELLHGLPTVCQWLGFAEDTRKLVEEKHKTFKRPGFSDGHGRRKHTAPIGKHCHPPCRFHKLANGDINLHGWVYKIETGEIFVSEPAQFVLLQKAIPLKSSLKQTAKSH